MFTVNPQKNKYFQYIPRLPVITLTNSNVKTITIPEDRTLYSFD